MSTGTADDGVGLTAQGIRDLVSLVKYVTGVVVTSFLLAPWLSRGWEEGGAIRRFFFQVVAAEYGIGPATVFPAGVLIGIITLLVLDRMKFRQGLLVMAGVAIGFVRLLEVGRFQGIELTQATLVAFVGGIAVGGWLGGGRALLDESVVTDLLNDEWEYQFPRAATLTWLLLTGIALLGILEYHIDYEEFSAVIDLLASGAVGVFVSEHVVLAGLAWHLLLVVAFSVSLHQFTQYENQKSIMLVGPRRGGKTTLMIGLYSTILREKDRRLPEDDVAANDPLQDRLQETFDADEGFGSANDPTPHHTIIPLVINYIQGRMFPMKTRIRSLDYGGERIDDRLVGTVETYARQRDRWPTVLRRSIAIAASARVTVAGVAGWGVGGVDPAWLPHRFPESELENLGDEDVYHELASALTDAERIVLVLPLDDFVEDSLDPRHVPSMIDLQRSDDYVNIYKRIIKAFTDADLDKEVTIVATMADLAKGAFEAHPDYPDDLDEDAWPRFMEFVTEEVLDRMELEELWNFAEPKLAFPVYFEPNENEPRTSSGDLNPQLDTGDIRLNGGEVLLDELGK